MKSEKKEIFILRRAAQPPLPSTATDDNAEYEDFDIRQENKDNITYIKNEDRREFEKSSRTASWIGWSICLVVGLVFWWLVIKVL